MPDFILASASPRRREMLERLGLDFIIRPADIEEIPLPGESPEHFAERAAQDKARALASPDGLPVLASDTVVEIDGEILGKPGDREDARRMLHRLSARSHRVHTGMALASGETIPSLVDTTRVSFAPLDDDLIEWYLQTGEPMDKAGAYGIQGAGGIFVVAIDGAPQTVIGLPVHRLAELFRAAGLNLPDLLVGGAKLPG